MAPPRLVDIGVFREGQKTIYEIAMVGDGKEFDVPFAADGKVLGRSFGGQKRTGPGSST